MRGTTATRVRERRDSLVSPFHAANQASIERKLHKPKDLLGWFVGGMHSEVPERIHSRGLWHDGRQRTDPEEYEPVGGSALGTLAANGQFRALTEGDPFLETELAMLTDGGVGVGETAYRFPMRAALKRLAGRGAQTHPYPFMARTLYRVSTHDGDWDAACRSMGINPEPVRWPYIVAALERLWLAYDDEPPGRRVRVVKEAPR